MPDGYVLNKELKDLLQREVARLANSFQARPKRGRRPRRAGRGGGGGSTIRRARALETIGPATDNETPITGEFEYCDDATGALTGETTEGQNFAPMTYVEDALLFIDSGKTPPEIINGTCGAFVWVEA